MEEVKEVAFRVNDLSVVARAGDFDFCSDRFATAYRKYFQTIWTIANPYKKL